MLALLKHPLRSAVDSAARWFGVLARRERANARALTVLTYHRVIAEERCATYPFPSLVMPLGAFRDQVRWLASRHEVLPLARALERNREGARPTRPLLSLTFDDGYDDAAENAAAVLEECGVRGTFFVTTEFVGGGGLLWFDRAALLFAELPDPARREVVLQVCGAMQADRLPPPGASHGAWAAALKTCLPEQRQAVLSALERELGGAPAVDGYEAMTVADLAAMHARGHEIGSHSATHELLPDLDEAALRREVRGPRESLVRWLGSGVAGFCYPNGDCDDRVVAAVSQAGHDYACTTRDGLHRPGDDPLRIRRIDIVPDRALDRARRFDATALRREMCGLYRRPRRSAPAQEPVKAPVP